MQSTERNRTKEKFLFRAIWLEVTVDRYSQNRIYTFRPKLNVFCLFGNNRRNVAGRCTPAASREPPNPAPLRSDTASKKRSWHGTDSKAKTAAKLIFGDIMYK
uniref:Uncharacterized protein n=1 Tax=Romanomermis culicivorax TaxID=13658 RepID=A0A915JD82_ROMCU